MTAQCIYPGHCNEHVQFGWLYLGRLELVLGQLRPCSLSRRSTAAHRRGERTFSRRQTWSSYCWARSVNITLHAPWLYHTACVLRSGARRMRPLGKRTRCVEHQVRGDEVTHRSREGAATASGSGSELASLRAFSSSSLRPKASASAGFDFGFGLAPSSLGGAEQHGMSPRYEALTRCCGLEHVVRSGGVRCTCCPADPTPGSVSRLGLSCHRAPVRTSSRPCHACHRNRKVSQKKLT